MGSFVAALLIALPATSAHAQDTSRPDSLTVARLYQGALDRISARDFPGAVESFREVLRTDSTHYESWIGLGEMYMRVGRFETARPYLRKALQADPDRVEAGFQLAQTYLRTQDLLLDGIPTKSDDKHQARRLLEAVVARHPWHIPSRMILGQLWMMVPPPDAKRALGQYEAMLDSDPANEAARAGAAASMLRLGRLEEATAILDELLAEDPVDQHLAALLGTARFKLGEYGAAIAALKHAIDDIDGQPRPSSTDELLKRESRRRVRQWNLRLAYLAENGEYPGQLEDRYRLQVEPVSEPSPVHFTDVGPRLGVAKDDRGRGSAWGDYDGDGRLDLFTTGIHTSHAMYRNLGEEGFADISSAAGVDDPRGGWGASCADYDGDGDLDLYVTRDAWEGGSPNSLLRNRGDGTFVEAAPEAGVDDAGDSFTHAWGDIDADGFLDLYVANGVTGTGTPNSLFRNRGDGTFSEVASQAGVAKQGKTLGVAFGDYDNDADLDLYVSDVGGQNTLYRNHGDGTFSDVTKLAGVQDPGSGSYVVFFFDYNNDTHLDLFVSAFSYYESFVESQVTGRGSGPSAPHLYRNNGDGTFTDVAAGTPLSRAVGSMGAGFGDVDYDGYIDVYLNNGGPNFLRLEPNILYRNVAGERFVDITESAGVGNLGKGHGVSLADYDGDGDLDIYAGLGGHYDGDTWPNALYRNDGHANHWLAVDLRGAQPNTGAIGARLLVRSGDHVQAAEISSGNGFGSTNSLPVEFGLGPRTLVDELHIRWPSGRREVHTGVAADQTLRLEEGQ
ncbi:MAG: tetratricopeptide repeat protein [Gemmatimonadetes bacterium]|nr:tetratricopeptide repeat protein [Gemmatimonadota bacterium]MBT7861204.1 tetratricopeptide repeat protein [Gemmatimonadota bacterium]